MPRGGAFVRCGACARCGHACVFVCVRSGIRMRVSKQRDAHVVRVRACVRVRSRARAVAVRACACLCACADAFRAPALTHLQPRRRWVLRHHAEHLRGTRVSTPHAARRHTELLRGALRRTSATIGSASILRCASSLHVTFFTTARACDRPAAEQRCAALLARYPPAAPTKPRAQG
jgi:hypothetical protein